MVSHQGLDHEDSPLPHVLHKGIDIDRLLFLASFQHSIEGKEGSCPAYTSAAVDQESCAKVFIVTLLHAPDEGDEGGGKLGYTMVRPSSKVILGHLQRLIIRLPYLHVGVTLQWWVVDDL